MSLFSGFDDLEGLMSIQAKILSREPALGMLILETKSFRCSITRKMEVRHCYRNNDLPTFARSVLAV